MYLLLRVQIGRTDGKRRLSCGCLFVFFSIVIRSKRKGLREKINRNKATYRRKAGATAACGENENKKKKSLKREEKTSHIL